MSKYLYNLLILLSLQLALSPAVLAHQTSKSYLHINFSGQDLSGQWAVNLTDLQLELGLDQNNDGNIVWKEILRAEEDLKHYVFSHLKVRSETAVGQASSSCQLEPNAILVETRLTGTFLNFPFQAQCQGTDQVITPPVTLEYDLMFDRDPRHLGILTWQRHHQQSVLTSGTSVFKADQRQVQLTPESGNSNEGMAIFADYLAEGIWHIWIGLDHLLFLIALIVPSVRLHKKFSVNHTLKDIALVVTCFTFAHSLTLLAGSQQWLVLPSGLTESLIAASVVMAGLNLIFPIFDAQRGWIAFAFGLVHGLGFASVFGELSLTSTQFYLGLLGFNLGVELGQLVVVLLILPILLVIKNSQHMLRYFVPGTGASIAVAGLAWLITGNLTI